MEGYKPEFEITPEMTSLTYEIAQDLERVDIIAERILTPKLRRENRAKTIRSSLYIEANTLNLEQVTDVIDGKKVIGPQRDIDEVKGAKEAYDYLLECDPYSIKDLLSEHRLMMGRVMEDAGEFRTRGVGVFSGNIPIHVAPPPDRVPGLMEGLFEWYKTSKLPVVIKSSIFHYEFEFIHPFADGNGRTGRLWQTLLLYQENMVFGWLPIETIIADNQQSYYDAIRESTKKTDSGIFAEFMLKVIKKALSDFRKDNEKTVRDIELS